MKECFFYLNYRLSDGDVRKLSIINVYIPRATERDERWTFKLKYLALLQHRAEALLRQGR